MSIEVRVADIDDVKDIVDVYCSSIEKWYKNVEGRSIEARYENLSVAHSLETTIRSGI